MERSLQQRLVGILVLAAFVLLIAPVLLDGEGRIPEKITSIPPQPKRPDLTHIRTVEPDQALLAPLPDADEPEFVIEASPSEVEVSEEQSTSLPSVELWSVQIASFRDPAKATLFRDRLRASDFQVYVREKLLSDGTVFTQVFVGPLTEKSDANALKAVLKQEFGEQGLVVRYRDES